MDWVITLIDRIAGGKGSADPFQHFRRRAFVLLLCILASVSFLQGVMALLSHRSLPIMSMMLTLWVLSSASILWVRQARSIETVAMIILMILGSSGALLDIYAGRSPNSPLLFWSPVLIFGGFVFCGLRRGLLVAVTLMIGTILMVVSPFLFHEPQLLPGGTTAEAYHRRLLLTVVLCHVFPLLVIGLYEQFFKLCHNEAQEWLDKVESRKDRIFLGRLARLITDELEPELKRMESNYEQLLRGEEPGRVLQHILAPLQRLVHLTRRYEPLSLGALAAIEGGLTLEDFPELIRRFTDFSKVSIQEQGLNDLRVRGGHAYFLLVFLCISLRELMERPGLLLQDMHMLARPRSLEIKISLQMTNQDTPLPLNQDFIHDLEADVQFRPARPGSVLSHIEIAIPMLAV